jgi:glyoxylase-like metal-dependent hydrolase (beta-lactamase superfamily II)
VIVVEDTEGVHKFRMARTLFGRGFYYTAAYWVDGLLIDTGCRYTVGELVSALHENAVTLIVNTHSHEDHIGANAALQRRFGAEIRIHPLGLHVLAKPREYLKLKPYQRILWGYPEASEARALGEMVHTPNHRFKVIHTPGHSLDHVCLYEPDRGWLFTGDTYIGGREQALRADYNIWQIIQSLRKLSKLDVTFLFPASGRVRQEGQRDLAEKIDYLEGIAEQTLQLHRKGVGYREIRRELFGAEVLIAYFTLGHFSGKHLVRSFVEDCPAEHKPWASVQA